MAFVIQQIGVDVSNLQQVTADNIMPVDRCHMQTGLSFFVYKTGPRASLNEIGDNGVRPLLARVVEWRTHGLVLDINLDTQQCNASVGGLGGSLLRKRWCERVRKMGKRQGHWLRASRQVCAQVSARW